MERFSQEKDAERLHWDKVAKERIYAAFDKQEYLDIFNAAFDKDLTGKRIVDIGCASGVSAALFAARGANVVGIDISPELIAQAKALWTEYADRLDFTVGDAEAMDEADGGVDACFFGGVLHHFPDRTRVYREALRVLKPGGLLVAVEPNRLDVFERIEWAVADLRGKLSPNEYPIDPFAMRRETLEAGFAEASFRTMRHDIPVLAQCPVLKRFFNRQKGFGVKRPLLRFCNAFRAPENRGTFFVMKAVKA